MVHKLVSLKVYPKIRVKTVLVNPTKYYARPYLTRYNYKDNVEEHEEFSGNAREENRTVVEGYNVLQDDAEFDQGIFYFFHLYFFRERPRSSRYVKSSFFPIQVLFFNVKVSTKFMSIFSKMLT